MFANARPLSLSKRSTVCFDNPSERILDNFTT